MSFNRNLSITPIVSTFIYLDERTCSNPKYLCTSFFEQLGFKSHFFKTQTAAKQGSSKFHVKGTKEGRTNGELTVKITAPNYLRSLRFGSLKFRGYAEFRPTSLARFVCEGFFNSDKSHLTALISL